MGSASSTRSPLGRGKNEQPGSGWEFAADGSGPRTKAMSGSGSLTSVVTAHWSAPGSPGWWPMVRQARRQAQRLQRVTGRSQPNAIGMGATVDCSTRTARRTPSRTETRRTASRTSSQAGDTPRRCSRHSAYPPSSGRNEHAPTPQAPAGHDPRQPGLQNAASTIQPCRGKRDVGVRSPGRGRRRCGRSSRCGWIDAVHGAPGLRGVATRSSH